MTRENSHLTGTFVSVLLGSLFFTWGCGDDPKSKETEEAVAPAVESSCQDGADNDADGAVDCDDSDCQSPGGECVAPPELDRTVATTLYEAVAHLYTGENPLQKGVAVDAIERRRAAWLRGRVIDVDGGPLGGGRITVLGHEEYGYTYSRGDGGFDLAVNGGARLVLNYELPGRLSVQRAVHPGWQRYLSVEDAGMVEVTGESSKVSADRDEIQTVAGALVEDEYGVRTPLVVVEPHTVATAILSDGTTQPLDEFSIAITQYPITERQEYLPGSATSSGGLSYGLEFSVQEAEELGARHVAFDQPVSVYVENLGEIAVGTPIAVEHYDRERGQWEPGTPGAVIELLDVTDGTATIDSDGDGDADDIEQLEAQGIGEAELQLLAERYGPGTKLWHGKMRHFSAGRFQKQGTAPKDAVAPVRRGLTAKTLEAPSYGYGMVIETQASTHDEPIAGTPYRLHYQSDRTLSYGAGRTLEVPVLGEAVPTGLKGVSVKIAVAGQTYEKTFGASELESRLRYSATWDGKDASGRLVQGTQVAQVTIAYVYQDAQNASLKAILPVSFDVPLGGWDARAYQLGGFAIDAFHAYDPAQQILYYGHGGQRSASNVSLVAKRVVLDESFDWGTPDSLTVASDGSLIITDDQQDSENYGRVLQVATDGTPSVLYGDGATGSAAKVQMTQPQGVVALSDGRLIIADIYDQRIVELGLDGSLTVLVSGNEADMPLVELALQQPEGLALGPREELYFVDDGKIYRYEAGAISVFAGGGTETAEGVAATSAKLVVPSGLAVDKFGRVFVSERGEEGKDGGHRVRCIEPNGAIRTIAGTGVPGSSGDGAVAAQAQLNSPHGLALDAEGQLYIVDQGNGRIRRVSSDGLIQTVIGGGDNDLSMISLAVNAKLNQPDGIAVGPDGSLYIATADTVLRAYVGLERISETDHLVPDVSGRTLYRFDQRGKHLETIDAKTAVTELRFDYDEQGRLAKLTDRDGNVTTIERDSSGQPTAIEAPYGQRTTLDVSDSGDVATITDPLERKTTITWTEDKDGLVEKVDDPKEQAKTFGYDPSGRLLSVTDPTGYATTLARSEADNGWSVAVTSPNENETTYETEYALERWRRTVTFPDGSQTAAVDAGAWVQRWALDGTTQETTFAPDMAFGAQSLVPDLETVTLPSGKTLETSWMRAKGMEDLQNPLELTSWVDSAEVGGRWYESSYDNDQRTLTQTSPMGRTIEITFDELGRKESVTASGMPTTEWEYDGRGRVVSVKQKAGKETREQQFSYDDGGWVEYFVDPLDQKTRYGRDVVGRLQSRKSPDKAMTYWEMGAADNVESYTPPGHPETVFAYDETSKLLKEVVPPKLDGKNVGGVTFSYGKENELVKLSRSDGKSVRFDYDELGQLTQQKLGGATIKFGYQGGKLTRVSRSDGVTLKMTYDGALWTESRWSGGIEGAVQATYDDNLWLSSLTVNDASTVEYSYDDDGLIIAANSSAGAVSIERDEATGFVTGMSAGAISSEQSFSKFGEMESLSTSYSGEVLFGQDVVERDALGRITHLTEAFDGTTCDIVYEYDLGGRVKQETRDGVATEYSYDTSGNRVSRQTGSDAQVEGVYDEQDRILSYGANTYEHDAHGDLKSRKDGSNSLGLSYDELGNLLKAVVSDGTTTTTVDYVIDGLGRRVGRRLNGSFDRAWLYRDALRPVAEIDANGVFTHYIYASNGTESGAPIALVRENVLYRVVKDQVGSVRRVVNAATGEVVQSLDYDAFGQVLRETGSGFQPFGFAGGLYDVTTKLVRFGARDYDAETGRWANKDPIGFAGQQGNVYLYVDGDPVNRVDPSGKIPPLMVGAIVIGSAVSNAIAKYYLGERKAEDAVLGFTTGTLAGLTLVTGSFVLYSCGAGLDLLISTDGFKDAGGAAETAVGLGADKLCGAFTGPAEAFVCPIAQQAAVNAWHEGVSDGR